jgi:hypothetical protein
VHTIIISLFSLYNLFYDMPRTAKNTVSKGIETPHGIPDDSLVTPCEKRKAAPVTPYRRSDPSSPGRSSVVTAVDSTDDDKKFSPKEKSIHLRSPSCNPPSKIQRVDAVSPEILTKKPPVSVKQTSPGGKYHHLFVTEVNDNILLAFVLHFKYVHDKYPAFVFHAAGQIHQNPEAAGKIPVHKILSKADPTNPDQLAKFPRKGPGGVDDLEKSPIFHEIFINFVPTRTTITSEIRVKWAKRLASFITKVDSIKSTYPVPTKFHQDLTTDKAYSNHIGDWITTTDTLAIMRILYPKAEFQDIVSDSSLLHNYFGSRAQSIKERYANNKVTSEGATLNDEKEVDFFADLSDLDA